MSTDSTQAHHQPGLPSVGEKKLLLTQAVQTLDVVLDLPPIVASSRRLASCQY